MHRHFLLSSFPPWSGREPAVTCTEAAEAEAGEYRACQQHGRVFQGNIIQTSAPMMRLSTSVHPIQHRSEGVVEVEDYAEPQMQGC